MRSQIAFVLFVLSPFCQGQIAESICPSAEASLCKGCCATDHKYDAPCARISDETMCGKQIACNWSDGPVSGTVYNALDLFEIGENTCYNCYQSKNISALIAYMATLKDDGTRAQYHKKFSPTIGVCGECWSTSYYREELVKFGYQGVVAPGVTEYENVGIFEKTSEAVGVQAAPTGKYTASVPFILTMTLNFNADGTMVDFDNNVKIAHQEINCPKSKIAITGAAVTFPNIGITGDCMGDALREQKKDVTKFRIDINSDGTLTFHSDGWPNLKLKKASEIMEVQAVVV